MKNSFKIGMGGSESGEWRLQAFVADQRCGSSGNDTGDQ